MQICSNPSGLLVKSTGAPHGDEEGHIALASYYSSYYFLIINYSCGLCLYIDFRTNLAPSTKGILCISPSFQLGGAHVGNIPGNTSRYLHNTLCNNALFFLSTFSNCRIAPSGRPLSPYNISYRNKMGLRDVFNYVLYII